MLSNEQYDNLKMFALVYMPFIVSVVGAAGVLFGVSQIAAIETFLVAVNGALGIALNKMASIYHSNIDL